LQGVADTPPPSTPASRFRLFPASWAARLGVLSVAWGLAMTTLSIVNASRSQPPANRPIEQPIDDYVSSDTCRACHPGNYASWHASYHRTMTQVAAPENFAADPDGLKLSRHGTDYHVSRDGRAYFVRTKPAGTADSAYDAPRQIVLLTGSHHLQVFWTETKDERLGRALSQFPFAYSIAEARWTPMTHTFLVPPEHQSVYSTGDWNDGCINCHTTHGRGRPGPDGAFDSRVGEFGISCEACHSGGKEHIAKHRNPARRFLQHLGIGDDDTIANPAKMDAATANLACGQCHSVWAFKNAADDAKFQREHGKFRPGMKELDLRWITQPGGTDHPEQRRELAATDPHYFQDRFWGDGMLRMTGREMNATMASPCAKGGHFSCLSCHEMHPAKTDPATLKEWRSGQLKPGMDGDQACLQCHQDLKANIPAHTFHAADSPGSSCYNCHMPHTSYGLLRALRSHQVSSPTARETLDHGRPNACNLCHLDRPLAWTATKLTEWYGHPTPELSADDRTFSSAAQLLLKGDASQRMLIVWSMGWAPAQKASGHDWLYPYLIFGLNDPYAAVRFGSWKSLQSLTGFSGYEYDYTVEDLQQKEASALAYQKWWHEVRNPQGGYRFETLLEPTGFFQQEIFDRMLQLRDRRKVYLSE